MVDLAAVGPVCANARTARSLDTRRHSLTRPNWQAQLGYRATCWTVWSTARRHDPGWCRRERCWRTASRALTCARALCGADQPNRGQCHCSRHDTLSRRMARPYRGRRPGRRARNRPQRLASRRRHGPSVHRHHRLSACRRPPAWAARRCHRRPCLAFMLFAPDAQAQAR